MEDIPESVLNEMEKAEFVKKISTLSKDMLTRVQLIKLFEDVKFKTSGNKEVLLECLKEYYMDRQDDTKKVSEAKKKKQ
jgi:hypothetical protein